MSVTPILTQADEGELMFFGGGLVTFKVTSEQSGGQFALIDDVLPKGKTTPLHLHESFDETICVVAGEILVHVDGSEHPASAGAVAFVPRGTPHAFLVTSDEARVLSFATPGDVFERFFREGGEPATSRDDRPPPLDIQKVKEAGERTGGMKVLGPPPFDLAGSRSAG